MTGCVCWEGTMRGHEGHCCFRQDSQRVPGCWEWRDVAEVCHIPEDEDPQDSSEVDWEEALDRLDHH